MAKSVIITPSKEDTAKVLGYYSHNKTKFKGSGQEFKNYECIYCRYATIYLEKMQKHQAEGSHPWGFGGKTEESEVGSSEPVF